MKILSPAISSLARMRMWRIDAWKNNPIEAQRDVLQNLVTAAQYTEFGRQYNFRNYLHSVLLKKLFLFMITRT
jgi:hypothetical protein